MEEYNSKEAAKHMSERRMWLEEAASSLRHGLIAEMGCGSGFAVEVLSDLFPESALVGVDRDVERIKTLMSKNLPKVYGVCGDVRYPPLHAGVFDTVCSLSTLHIIFSQYGTNGVRSALLAAVGLLKPSGRLLIQDFLRPPIRMVELRMKNKTTVDCFFRFAAEFEPRRVEFSRKGDIFRLDIADAIEFMTKYRYAGADDWAEEMTETHLYFTRDDFRNVLTDLGMTVVETKQLPRDKISMAYDDIECDFDIHVDWIHIVAER